MAANHYIPGIDDRDGNLSTIKQESYNAIVISTASEFSRGNNTPTVSALSRHSISLLAHVTRLLKYGGLLFIYGRPHELVVWGRFLSTDSHSAQQMVFKHWIALDIEDAPASNALKPTHKGLLMYLKARTNPLAPALYHLNTNAVRLPYVKCTACGRTLKDWGGKKHLMNPKGSALSDVWRDLPRRKLTDSTVPEDVLARIRELTQREGGHLLHVVQREAGTENRVNARANTFDKFSSEQPEKASKSLQLDQVLETDCVAYLHSIHASHPEGLFDLAFADPPYNLQKLYGNYDDALSEQRYIQWCNEWLGGMARALKPGGSLFVLNIPKWAIHHAAFLNNQLEFRRWIVWDALSDPRGKLMPAHYALLWYTRPEGKPAPNYAALGSSTREEVVSPPDSPRYCLRAGCIKERKRTGDDEKVELSDVWFDIHRIKHKRDRDSHPCQLPEKLLERIILLTTNPGDLVFDSFCGTGPMAVAATKLGRKFIATDLDPNYVRIAREKLATWNQHAQTNGTSVVRRPSVRRPTRSVSKKKIELYLQQLARRLNRVPEETDVNSDNPGMLEMIDAAYPYRSAAFKRARVALQA
jgi:DNA modification methylase